MTQSATHPHLPHLELSRVLGIVFGLAVVVGGVIGSGIMRAPGVVALGIRSEPLTLLFWAGGGALAMLTAMPLVEAGASVPRAGGSYPIATRAFGRAAGFMTGWLTWLQFAASNAFISVVFAEYVQRLGFATALPKGIIAAGLIVAVAAINWTGTRISGASQSIASAVKGGAFLLVAGVLFLSPRAPAGFHPAVVHPALVGAAAVSAVIMAVRVIYQTYAGWDGAIYFSEEVDRPERNVGPGHVHGHRPRHSHLSAGQRRHVPCSLARTDRRLATGGGGRDQGLPRNGGQHRDHRHRRSFAGRHRQSADHGRFADHVSHGR